MGHGDEKTSNAYGDQQRVRKIFSTHRDSISMIHLDAEYCQRGILHDLSIALHSTYDKMLRTRHNLPSRCQMSTPIIDIATNVEHFSDS